MITDFVVIDDEIMSNRICEIVISRTFPEADLKTFINPLAGFEHIVRTYSKQNANNVIVFLDLMMPVTDGWQILSMIDELPDNVKRLMNIYVLSSSTDLKDIKRANENPLIKKFIRKPLFINTLHQQISNTDFL